VTPATQEATLPLSGRILQWRAEDGAWRSLASREDEADVEFQPWTGAAGVLIQADGDVWHRPSWLVAWSELPESGRVEVLRTDGQVLELTVIGRVWACEWIGQGEPITVQYDDGFPQTVRIDRPDYL
jgi:hypothetical protein